MTTEALGRSATSACNGATRNFPVPFQFIDNGDLQIYLLDAQGAANDPAKLLTEGVDYTVSGNGRTGTATVTTSIAYPTGKYLRRWRRTSRAQTADYVANDGFPAEAHETQLDRLSMVDEEIGGELADTQTRAMLAPAGEHVGPLPDAEARKNKAIGFAADGLTPVALTIGGEDSALRSDLADAAAGAALVRYRGRTAAQKMGDIVSVLDLGAVGDGETDDTDAIHAAKDEVKGTGKTLIFPGEQYLVSELVWDGSDYAVETNGALFKQKTGLTGDGNAHPIWTVSGERIRFGNARFQGNIATDADQFSHAVAIMSAKDVKLGHLHGEDIRGDVVYVYGRASSEAEKCYGVSIDGVTGDNIFRVIFAATGGQGRVGYVRRVGTGRVGYKDIDIEPNDVAGTTGDYQAPDWEFGHLRGATVQAISADADVQIKSVRFGSMDLDGSRIANSSPANSDHPGTNDYALAVGRINAFHGGDMTIANYDFSPVQISDSVGRFSSNTVNVDDVARTDETYKTVFLHLGSIRPQVLEIGLIQGTLFANDRMIFRSDSQFLNLNVGKVKMSGGLFGSRLTGHVEQVDLDCGDPSGGVVFDNCDGLDIGTGTVTNTANAWGFADCQRVKLTDFTANFGAGLDFTAGGRGPSQDIIAFSSDINGMNVPGVNFLLGGAVHVGGVKIVGSQQAAITDPTGGTTVDAQARTALTSLLAAARAHGLIAP